jgi:hypothetical protein
MATVTKDFKVKNGLIVEGTTGSINNFDILTKKTDDQNYIVNLIGGTATSANEANKVVKRDANGNFAAGTITANLTGDVTGNADTATTLETARTIELTGNVTGSVSFNGSQNVQISTTIDSSFATDAEVATAKGEAIDAAEAYTDGRETAITTAYQAYADLAESDAKAYTDARETAITTAYQSYADAAETDAINAANAYTDQEVAALVNGAPALLDTLNELATAINSDAGFATTIGTQIGEKVAKAGDTMTGALTLSGAPTSANHAATKQYVDTAESNAVTTANAYTDNALYPLGAPAFDSYGSASAAEAAAIAYADALDTDDVAEGENNLYYTDTRAKSAVFGGWATDFGNVINNANKTNIVATYSPSMGLTLTAENGVADSTTDDLDEGTTNLYFTDVRAVSALEAVTPDFPAVEIASVAKQVAASATVATASTNTAVSWAKSAYRSAEFLVKIANGSHTEVSKVILTLDTSDNVAITEYAMVGTNGDLGSVTADVNGSDVRLRVATINNDSTVSVVGTLLV